MGSCFAQNIGNLMQNAKLDVCVNPFGITYNPLSIAAAINRMLDGKQYKTTDLSENNGLWFSFDHHGEFDSTSIDATLDAINSRFTQAATMLHDATHLIITFGSSYVYTYNGKVVNNCHKLPNRLFEERQLDVGEIVDTWAPLLQRLSALKPDLHIIFTVSPVRYLGHGAHASQTNKATLLLAIDQLCQSSEDFSLHKQSSEDFSLHPATHYFPSYEIMLDELRDYRFYADDMIHPTPLAVNIIWQRFRDTYITSDGKATMAEVEKIIKSLSHRPLHPDTDAYRLFQSKTADAIARLQKQYPKIEF